MSKPQDLINETSLIAVMEHKGEVVIEFDFPVNMETGQVFMRLLPDNARAIARLLLQSADNIDGAISYTPN